MPFGTGYTEYQPEIIFLDLLRGKNDFFSEPIVKLQNTKVLLNLYRQPYHLILIFRLSCAPQVPELPSACSATSSVLAIWCNVLLYRGRNVQTLSVQIADTTAAMTWTEMVAAKYFCFLFMWTHNYSVSPVKHDTQNMCDTDTHNQSVTNCVYGAMCENLPAPVCDNLC